MVIDDQVLAFRIDSQEHELSSLDWRKSIEVAGFALCRSMMAQLPRFAFMHRMGLFTGSLDLIVDPEQQVRFLECNQDGAWGWLDNTVEGAITRAFADGLDRRLSALEGDGQGP
ncbi:MAG TPA: hypothetical protein VKM72_10130 [Thermoanaerobaculia bacterium]|nr:hypothetical protein [Thermoanaerobaculia bacterium]